MQGSSAVRRYAASMAAVALVVTAGQTTGGIPGEVAHSAMGGSTLMRTTAEINAWTHRIVDEDGFVELSVGDAAYPGNGFVDDRGQATVHWKFDDENHLLFRVRQNDLGGQNTNFLWGGTLEYPVLTPAMLVDVIGVTDYNAFTDGQMLNLAWASPMSSGGAFSVGMFVASRGMNDEENSSSSSSSRSYADAEELNVKSTAFGGQATWGSGNGLDLSLSISREGSASNYAMTEREDGNLRREQKSETEGSILNLALAARFEQENGWISQLGGIIASGTRKHSSYDFRRNRTPSEVIVTNPPDRDYGVIGVVANVGRRIVDTEAAVVTSEVFVNYARLKMETQRIHTHGEDEHIYDLETHGAQTVIPGMRVACWAQVSRRFHVMAGANAYWMRLTDKSQETLVSWPVRFGAMSSQSEGTHSEYGMVFHYSGGLAYVPSDRLRIEGQFAMDQLNRILSLGNTTPLLMRVGGTFTF